jgi:hypothetical protein
MLFKHSLGGDVIGSLLQGFVGQGIDLPEQKTIDKNDKGGRDHANDGSTHVGLLKSTNQCSASASDPLKRFERSAHVGDMGLTSRRKVAFGILECHF